MYTPLHVHSSLGSLLDSMVNIPDLMSKCKELGISSCAITDHGNMMAVIEFYTQCEKNEIKPIIGMEAYYTPDCEVRDKDNKYDHLILLAATNEGYKNLKMLATYSQKNFYSKPRLDNKALKMYGKGIIGSTSCIGGTIPQMILADEPIAVIKEKIEEFKGFFDEFYLELQPSSDPQQEKVNTTLVSLGKSTNTPLIITTDVHRIEQNDMEAHQAFISIVTEGIRSNEFYLDAWLKTEDEIKEKLQYLPKDVIMTALKNTNDIAEKCNVEIELGKSYFPKIQREGFSSDKELFKHLINIGLEEKKIWDREDKKVYLDRVKYEFEVITGKDFEGFFIILQEYIKRAKEKGVCVGFGRGSAGGCLIAWLLGLTRVDSIRWGLSFERFLNPSRSSPVDIDTDVSDVHRQLFIEAMREVSGGEVYQVVTTGTLKAKSIVASVGKVLGYEIEDLEPIKKKIPENGTINDLIKLEPNLYKQEQKLLDMCDKLEGLYKSNSIHASAIIAQQQGKEMEDFCPVMKAKDGSFITQFNGHDCEAVGLVKQDILGLRTLSIVNDCIKMIKEV